jgi:hypothetical protein
LAASGEDTLSPRAIKTEIAAIESLAHEERTAAQAVRRAEAVLPKLRDGDDSAAVLLYESDAYLIQGDSIRPCNILKRIGARGNSTVRASVSSQLPQC